MKFSAAAVLAAAAGASAGHVSNVTYTTEVVTAYTTYCPGPTEIVHGDKTYTVTKATTLTITDCPCTVTKPVITTSAVVCHHCSAPGYTNSTLINVPTQGKPEEPKPTGSKPSGKPETPTQVPVAGAGKVALSGAGLAGVVGLAAFFL